ncbi:MAG TPA: CpsD/CapB family tyrosine-protein kinase [Hydrogenophaga sp.]|uniref:CpsD/CapB family tyrosine-protein kinase n=1 Tax=Hydrogenophaga sp. TaxID=1904254 RepID=UPI002BD0239B|nr:CpsD/CapB family tyrosine-protein kinase [Hydrogenophaga sp.]HMN91997.1 CpsD/CapB family tyrosine-protein kinase [Hydrogenophaga sp.]HMP08799.1 CpsD/CapB family tyrosine-protein kinase [Hydrogenophaga sp.]
MERIKEAIEKAKTQRGVPEESRPGAVALEAVPRGLEPTTAMARPHAIGTTDVTDGDVWYRQTPVIKLDAAHLESHRIVAHQKAHPASWAFDLLRTQVLQTMDEHGWRTLAVTSPTPEAGKTVVAINLAIAIAQHSNRTALLVDLDLRRPRVAASLGLAAKISLNEVLAGAARVEEAMVNPSIPRLVVLPSRQAMPGSAELLGSSKVAAMMSELRERYADRVLVVDLPPVLAVDDVLAILPRIDCLLMVVGNGTATRNEINESMRRLSKGRLLGVVLNKDDAPTHNAYY